MRKSFFQPKLTINQSNDEYEQEADAMADEIMRMSVNDQSFFSPKPVGISHVQRKCAHCEEEEKLLRKENKSQSTEAGSETNSYISSLSSKGSSLSKEARSFFEPRFGYDFSDVKIHNDSEAAKSADGINALAYTNGNNIVFNQNQFSPESDGGKKLLAHELTHVVQQNGKSYSIQRSVGPIDCSPANIKFFVKKMHRRWCDKPRKCSLQGDTCATATAKWAAGNGCVDARIALQQKCFRKGDIDYEDHMDKIAEYSAVLSNCTEVMDEKCSFDMPPPVPVPVTVPVQSPQPVRVPSPSPVSSLIPIIIAAGGLAGSLSGASANVAENSPGILESISGSLESFGDWANDFMTSGSGGDVGELIMSGE